MMGRQFAGVFLLCAGLGVGPAACEDDDTSPGPVGGGTTTGSTSTTTTTDTTTDTGGGGSGGSCQDDGQEPNGTPADASELPALTDQDPPSLPELSGVVAGETDIDWYRYEATDLVGLAVVDPERQFDDPSTILRLCAYFWCVAPAAWGPPGIGDSAGAGGGGGAGPHTCPDGTETATQDLSVIDHDGEPLGTAVGCCTTAGTTEFHLGGYFPTVHWPLDCPGVLDDEDMLVFISVESYSTQPADICEPYTVRYHF